MLTIFMALALLAVVLAPILPRIQATPWQGFADRFSLLHGEAGAITLAEAQVNTQDDVRYAVIDQFRRYSWLLDQVTFDDCVNPGTGGATMTYGYTRLITATSAAFRAINAEYTPGKATRQRFTTDLKPLGGSFEVDRVIARLGSAATNETNFQMDQLLKQTRSKFTNEVINGDVAVDADGFDGLDKSLIGSSTEFVPAEAGIAYANWTSGTITSQDLAHGALDVLDEFLALVEGGAEAILGNRQSITRVRSLARRAGYYTREEDALGRTIERYGNAVLVDVGDGVVGATETPVIPIETRDPDGVGAGGNITGLTDIYAVRFGLDAFHGVSTVGELMSVWLPDFSTAGAVKTGEAELGPVSMVLKNTKGAAVLRNVKVQ